MLKWPFARRAGYTRLKSYFFGCSMGIVKNSRLGKGYSLNARTVIKALACAGCFSLLSACDDGKQSAASPAKTAQAAQADVFHAEYKADRLKWQVKAGSKFVVPVTVENTSQVSWSSGSGRVFVAYNWLYVDEQMLLRDGLRTPFPQDIAPGKEVLVNTNVIAPKEKGIYLLRVNMVQEGIAWFSDRKVKPLDLTVVVE